MTDLLSCRAQDNGEDNMSGQAMIGQAVPGTLASGDGNDSTDSQVVFGVTNVHVDAVVLLKGTYIHTIEQRSLDTWIQKTFLLCSKNE